jgi:rhodanese-related sulfurtransferase
MADITLDTKMADILSAYPQAKIGLFQKYHIGGCKSCSYDLNDTLGQVRVQHNITAGLDEILRVIQQSSDVEQSLHLSVADFRKALDEGMPFRILDARDVIDYEDGHIPGAKFLNVQLQFEALDAWPKDTAVVVVSNHGERSLARASHFKAYGLVNVRSLDGGLAAWRAAGGPIETGLQPAGK